MLQTVLGQIVSHKRQAKDTQVFSDVVGDYKRSLCISLFL